MHSTFFTLRRLAGLSFVGAALAFPAFRSSAADPSVDADAFPTFESYLKVSGQAPFITGDSAAFAQRSGIPNSTGAFGIEDLYFSKDLNDTTSMKVDGHALDGSDDYLASFNLSKDNIGSVDVGYKRFRTFYDGVGGFFPLADQFQAMSPQSLHVDRSSFWIDTKFGKSDGLLFTVSFHDDIRTGEKDSTIWGPEINPNATLLTSGTVLVTSPVPNPSLTPYTVPNVLSLAEHHRTLDAGLTDTVGKITETFKATFDWVANVDTRYYTKYPGSKVTSTAASLTAKPAVSATYYPVNVTDDQETVNSRGTRILDQIEAKVSDKLSIEAGFTFHDVSSIDGGEWITPAYSTTALAIYPALTAGNILADAKVDDYVGNFILKATPTKDWLAEVGIRDEYNVISDAGGFTTTSLATGATSLAASNVTVGNDLTYSHEDDHIVTPEASLQYLGIRNVSLYASFDKRVNRGEQHWVNPYAATSTAGITGVVTTVFPAPLSDVFFQDANQDYENAKIGANWNASKLFSLRAEVFRKDHQNRFIGTDQPRDHEELRRLLRHRLHLHRPEAQRILKPTPQLTFTTRYQPQAGNMSVLGIGGSTLTGGDTTEVTSGKARTQTISETVDWSPYTADTELRERGGGGRGNAGRRADSRRRGDEIRPCSPR